MKRIISTAAVILALAYVVVVGQYTPPSGGGSGAATWGSITGTITSQTDLQNQFATKQAGLPVTAATFSVLPFSATYDNGTAGVGATWTAGSAGVLTIDGVTINLNDRILFSGGLNTAARGLYALTTVGTNSVPYVLTRTTDFDTAAKINSMSVVSVMPHAVPPTNTYGGSAWAVRDPVTTVGTDPIVFTPIGVWLRPPYAHYDTQNIANTYGPLFSVTVPPTTNWSSVNVGTSSFTQGSDGSIVINWQTSSGQNQARCYMQALPASTGYSASIGQATRAANVGVGIANGTSGSSSLILVWQDSAGTISSYNFSAGGATLGGQYFADFTKQSVSSALMWFQIKDASSNRVISISGDGDNWTPINSQASHTNITETQFGPCHETNVTPATLATKIVDFRMTTP